MNGDRVVFMGTPAFAVASLDALVNAGITVAAVVTAADKPAGRGLRSRASAVKERAIKMGIPVLQPADLRDPGFLAALDRCAASIYVVVAFRKLPREVYERPALGTINLHASLLPDYRGAAPINWAVMNGEKRTGATTFYIQEKIDTGDLIHQAAIEIGPDATAGEVHDRLMLLGAGLVTRSVREIMAGTVARTPQPALAPGSGLHPAPKLTPEICRIRWDRRPQQVHDQVRGLSPLPGAWCLWKETSGGALHFKVLLSRMASGRPPGPPGTVHMEAGSFFVACADGWLELLEVQPEGRRRMSASDLIRGLRTTDNILMT